MQDFYRMVGPSGMLLVVLSLICLYLTLKNLTYFIYISKDFKKKFSGIESGETKYSDIIFSQEACRHNPLINIINEIVRTHARHSDDIRAEVAYLFHRSFASINRDVHLLRLISVISPLLGLMGTILGILGVFQTMAATPQASQTVLLANGIWEALLTTIMGLSVAIPALIAFYGFSLKLKSFHIEAVEHSYHVVERFNNACPHSAVSSKEDL